MPLLGEDFLEYIILVTAYTLIFIHVWILGKIFPNIPLILVFRKFIFFILFGNHEAYEWNLCLLWIHPVCRDIAKRYSPFLARFHFIKDFYRETFLSNTTMKYKVMFYNVSLLISYIPDQYFSLLLAVSLPSFNLNLQFTHLHIQNQFYISKQSLAEAKTWASSSHSYFWSVIVLKLALFSVMSRSQKHLCPNFTSDISMELLGDKECLISKKASGR